MFVIFVIFAVFFHDPKKKNSQKKFPQKFSLQKFTPLAKLNKYTVYTNITSRILLLSII